MVTHSSDLAWIIPGMGEPGGLPSMGSHRVGHNWSDLVVVVTGGTSVGQKLAGNTSRGLDRHNSSWFPGRARLLSVCSWIPQSSHKGTFVDGLCPLALFFLPQVSSAEGGPLLLLLLLSRFSRVRLYVTPQMAAHQALPSLGFSRQEHWSGLPFPYPVHESEKWKWSCSVVSDSLRPHGLQPTRLLHPWDLPGKSTGVGCHHLLRKSPFRQEKITKWGP